MGAVIALDPEELRVLEAVRAVVNEHGVDNVRRALDILSGTAERTGTEDRADVEPCPFK